MMKRKLANPLNRNQQGAVLVVGLLILLLLTLIGTSAMQGTSMQERMSGNMRDRNLAFQAAEAALREAERAVRQGTATVIPLGSTVVVDPDESDTWSQPGDPAFWADIFTDSDKHVDFRVTEYGGDLTGIFTQPMYVVETLVAPNTPGGGEPVVENIEFGPISETTSNMFRVTVFAVGGTEAAVVILQTNLL